MSYKLKENKIVKFLLLILNSELLKQLITLPQPFKLLLTLEKKLETYKLLLAITKHKIKFSPKDYQLSMLTELLMPLLLPQFGLAPMREPLTQLPCTG